MSSRDCCKDGTSRPDFDPKRNFMGQPWLDHEDSTPPLSYLDQASAAPLFGHAPYTDEDIWSAVEKKRQGGDQGTDEPSDLKSPEWSVFSDPSSAQESKFFKLKPVD